MGLFGCPFRLGGRARGRFLGCIVGIRACKRMRSAYSSGRAAYKRRGLRARIQRPTFNVQRSSSTQCITSARTGPYTDRLLGDPCRICLESFVHQIRSVDLLVCLMQGILKLLFDKSYWLDITITLLAGTTPPLNVTRTSQGCLLSACPNLPTPQTFSS